MAKLTWETWAPEAGYSMCLRGKKRGSDFCWYVIPVLHVYVRTEPCQAFEDAGMREFEGNESDIMLSEILERDSAETDWWGGEHMPPWFVEGTDGAFVWRNWDNSGCDWAFEPVCWLSCNDADGAFDRWPDRAGAMRACEADCSERLAAA